LVADRTAARWAAGLTARLAQRAGRPAATPEPEAVVMAVASPRLFALSDNIARGPAPALDLDLERYRWLLLMRFALLNAGALALASVAWSQGWLSQMLASDDTRLCAVIVGVFLVGLARAAERTWMLSRELNDLAAHRAGAPSKVGEHLARLARADATGRATLAASLRLKLAQRIAGVKHIASSLVLLGLIGTVVGFVVALSGVDPANASDPASIGPMVSTLIAGMSVALYTTLLGAVLNIWLMLDYRLLEAGAVHLFTHIVELGEQHGRA
jgi:biopolymer transport protein ExbB/TolQ